MKTEYLRTASNSYMIIREAEYLFEPYELQMVLQNKIEHLLPMQIIIADGKTEYWYDVTGLQTLQQNMGLQAVNGTLIRRIMEELCGLKTELEEYFLQDTDIDYAPGMIFQSRSGQEIKFCYIPGYGTEHSGGIKGLLEKILQHLDHSDADAVRIAYGLYDRCEKNDLTLADYYECLYGEAKKETDTEYEASDWEKPLTDKETLREEKRWEEPEFEPLQVSRKKKHRFFHRDRKKAEDPSRSAGKYDWHPEEVRPVMVAEPSVLENRGETVCFSTTDRKTVWELQYRGDGLEENLRIDTFPYRIGKYGGKVDGKLYAQTVSRMHAEITGNEGELFLTDYNSTNGTYLNGHLLSMNTPMPLHEGDHIIFATEEYVLTKRLI